SARPPVFEKGLASEPMRRTDRDLDLEARGAARGVRALGFGPGAPAPVVDDTYATRADSGITVGTCRSGIGGAANSLTQGFAIMRAQVADRLMRALSVAIPVLA